jgi:predicted restriction endonuclease
VKRSPIRPVSAKRRKAMRQYQQARKDVLSRCGGRCEARTQACTGRAEQTHHIRLRSQGGEDAAHNLLGICAACHSYAHHNVAWAVEHGLIWQRSAA